MTSDKRTTGKAEYNRKSRNKRRDIGGKSAAPSRAGIDFEKPPPGDEMAWMKTYLPAAFPLPFGDVHHEIRDAFRYSLETGDDMAAAAPRGTGKSTEFNALALRAVLEGITPFPAVIPWDGKAKKRALRFWANELCFNARLHRDYPEATAPFKACRGVANRLAAVTQNSEATGARLGLDEGVIVLPNGLGAIGSATINGNPRGLNYSTIDGRTMRPSFALIDDPQDRKTAKSKSRVQDTIDRIRSDVKGMAGPDSKMPIVLSGTVLERDDVMEYFLSLPDWRSVRVGQITAWPKDFTEKGSESRKLWDEWNDIRQDGEREKNEGKNALRFYVEHQAAMTEGMAVSWAERYDRRRGQPDALYAAMHDYYVMGEAAFAAERQNEPLKQGVTLYNLTPEIIQSRATDRLAGVVPDWATDVIAATDVNPSYGLTWGAVGFRKDQAAAVIAYGIHQMHVSGNETTAVKKKAVTDQLVLLGKKLAALPCKPKPWIIDAGGESFEAVTEFCVSSVASCGMVAIAATGKAAKAYKPYGSLVHGSPREGCFLRKKRNENGVWISWINWHADQWRECAQKAWTGSIGAPGSCSLPAGHHREFAEQICREQLQGKGEIGGQMVWVWNTQPGAHDFGDVMAMAYMGAAWSGIGTSGQVLQPKAIKRRPRSGGVVYL